MTDFRALCAQLVENLERYQSWYIEDNGYGIDDLEALLRRADTALAQAEPQVPTDEELKQMFHANDTLSKHCEAGTDWSEPLMMKYEFPAVARAVLARWGRAALAQPEPQVPTDEEIEQWADAATEVPLEEMDPEVHGWRRCFTAKEFSETIRAALAHWGSPTSEESFDG